jgi:arsenite methyltransferase
VDLWRGEDQSGNRPDAALENARREGVADRVRVQTGDMRALPFADAGFDVVLSHWVVHNLPDQADRARALDEMLRVLRPGGTLVLADIANHQEYRARLGAGGLTDMTSDEGGAAAWVMGVATGGSFRPRAWLGRRAD